MKQSRRKQSWLKPELGWVKCKFDRVWEERTKRGGVGVIIRNCSGEFLASYSGQTVGVSSPLQTELLAREGP